MGFRRSWMARVSGGLSVGRATRLLSVAGLITMMGLGLLAPSCLAAFTRPFIRQINGTPASPFNRLGGIAVDGSENLFVVNQPHEQPLEWDEFEKAGGFRKILPLGHFADSLAIETATSAGHFYVTNLGEPNLEVLTNTGELLNSQQQVSKYSYVAVDNSPVSEALDPSRCTPFACTVYVSHGQEGLGGSPPRGIERFEVNAAGEPTTSPFTFTDSGSGSEYKYIEGDQIVGTPEGPFESPGPTPGNVAVDSHGNIYVIGNIHVIAETKETVEILAVYEYEPSGKFVRDFTGTQTPGLAGNVGQSGWGGFPNGVAIDASSEHLLVSVGNKRGNSNEAGAIDEFNAVTGEYLEQITATDPKVTGAHLHNPEAIAVDSHGDLYVVDENSQNKNPELVHVVDEYGPPGFHLPRVKIGETSKRTPDSAVVSGSVNPEGQPLSACTFQYVTEAEFKAEGFTGPGIGTAPCEEPNAAEIGNGSASVPVHAGLTGLTSGVTYRYRLVATSEGGGEAVSEALAFTAPAAPRIESTSATKLSSTFAELHAQIAPNGADTTYHFEYLTAAAYHANGESFSGLEPSASVPMPPADIGSGGATGDAEISIVQHIGGLIPATGYRFRVVASNEIGPTEGTTGEFTTLPQTSPGLPDNRAYELLTPPDKGSSGDMFGLPPINNGEFLNRDVGYPSESGDEFLLQTTAAFGPFPASGNNAYVFSRSQQAWTYTSLSSPSLGVQGVFPLVFDPADLSRVGVEDRIGSTSSVAGSLYSSLIGPPGGPYTNLHSDSAVYSLGERSEEATEIVGASHDLDQVVLESKNHALAPGAEEQDKGSNALYESTGAGECTIETTNCTLINVQSNGELVSRCGAVLGLGTFSLGVPFEPESPAGNGTEGTSGKIHNAVSADGSRVIFTAPDPFAVNDGPGCWGGLASPQTNPPQLYTRSHGTTIEVSAPEAGAPEVGGRYIAKYVGASEDGSRIFFVSEAELTKSDEGIHDSELYEWRAEGVKSATGPCTETTGCLTRVSAGEAGSPAATAGSGVFAVPQVSAEGSAVYFLAQGQLTATQPPAPAGELNVYYYDTTTSTTTYVATVSSFDWTRTNGIKQGAYGVGFDPREDWYTTPDGRYLLFGSTLKLTSQPDPGGLQLYRYQAQSAELPSGELQCVSCAPEGIQPVPNPSSGFSRSALETPDAEPVSAMSNDGSYVFFDTAQALVPQDTNGTLDVYEWHEGTVSLISSGQDSTPSYFLGASPDGSNVFFGTHARLVPQDTDTAGDLYDARICTTEDPCIKPPPGETTQCEGAACQNPPPPLAAPTPMTLTLASSGNLTGKALNQPRSLTRAQRLSRALVACRKGPKRKRGSCEKQARKRYGPKSKAGKKAGRSRRGQRAKSSRGLGK
jgi:hypothetical protein